MTIEMASDGADETWHGGETAGAGETESVFREVADYRLRPHGIRVLLTPISWEEQYGFPGTRTFTAPAGMVHDGASIPIFLSFLNGPSIQLAATLHDAAYRFHAWDRVDDAGNVFPAEGEPMTRWEADLLILRAAKVCQMRAREAVGPTKAAILTFTHFMQRWMIWAGLQPAGILPWRRSPKKKNDYDHKVLNDIEKILTALRLATTMVPHDPELAEIEAEKREEQEIDLKSA